MSGTGKIIISPRWRRRLFILLILAVAYLLGATAQEQLGISFTVEGLQEFRRWVQSLGWLGPAVFILLVVFRLFIGLSSHLVLILGGLAFGATGGILWGCLGLVASASVLFYLAQLLGVDWVQHRFGEQYTSMLARIERVGALCVSGHSRSEPDWRPVADDYLCSVADFHSPLA